MLENRILLQYQQANDHTVRERGERERGRERGGRERGREREGGEREMIDNVL